jgi:Fe-S-cluster containining protein
VTAARVVEPSTAVCVDQCGSRCCQIETTRVQLTDPEMRTLKRLAGMLGIRKLPVVDARSHKLSRQDRRAANKRAAKFGVTLAPATKVWGYDFASTGGKCVFLDGKGLCRIYAHRPNACRTFPERPVFGCLVWPADPGDPDADYPDGVVHSTGGRPDRFPPPAIAALIRALRLERLADQRRRRRRPPRARDRLGE